MVAFSREVIALICNVLVDVPQLELFEAKITLDPVKYTFIIAIATVCLKYTFSVTSDFRQSSSIRRTFKTSNGPTSALSKVETMLKGPCKRTTQWFDDRKSITLEIPYCKRNEDETKKLINKLTFFTQGHYRFCIVWRTRKIHSLFKLKDKTNHPSSVVYYGTCTSCKSAYVGESARNFSIRQAEHEDTRKFSEPARHSASHPGHTFQWKILAFASSWILRRTLETIFIAKLRPNLNKQVHSFHLILFPNGIT